MSEQLEIRIILMGKDVKSFLKVKDWLNKQKNTDVVRALIDAKYQEIKKLKVLSGNQNQIESQEGSS